jgi:hypothetical protein
VGDFSLDLIEKDVTQGKPLIVENQLAGVGDQQKSRFRISESRGPGLRVSLGG